ncbi:uncharacterized protein LOC125552796 isoform X1 [Triticum urartu]|uniref:Uncharacterized protein n=1 Tax=Triticum urartu TaxID=4572 RepID=A0A8R7P5B4_TRIUA|nr:uncharacterized protein LOC125552796 isoform X1 [Triticum urartu]
MTTTVSIHSSRPTIALAALESFFRAVSPEAVGAVVDYVIASSPSSTPPSELFRSLRRSFPKALLSGHRIPPFSLHQLHSTFFLAGAGRRPRPCHSFLPSAPPPRLPQRRHVRDACEDLPAASSSTAAATSCVDSHG